MNPLRWIAAAVLDWLERQKLIGESRWDLPGENEMAALARRKNKKDLGAWIWSGVGGMIRQVITPETRRERIFGNLVQARAEFEAAEKDWKCPRCGGTRIDPEHDGPCGECALGWEDEPVIVATQEGPGLTIKASGKP